jgi:hypothetical protein
MRRTLFFLAVGVALSALPAGAQDSHLRVVIRDTVKAASPRAYQGRTRNNGPEETEKFSRRV